MAAVNLAKAWGNGEGIAHMTLSEAKQQFDEETLRLLDPAAYHELKAQEREETIRGYIADDQQRQVLSRAVTEERSREVLRDMITTNNQIAYHNFVDRVDATDKELGDMLVRQRQKLFEAQRELHRLRDNGLHRPDGSIIYPKADGTGATDSHGNPVAIDIKELQREMAEHPNATTSEEIQAASKKVDVRAEQVKRNEEYRSNLEQMKTELAKHKDDPDYQQRVEAFNKKWASMLDKFPERARERLFRHDPEAAAVYSQYGDKSGKTHAAQTNADSDDLPALSKADIAQSDIAATAATSASPVISQFTAAAAPATAEEYNAQIARIQSLQAESVAPANDESKLSSQYNILAKGGQLPAAATDYFAMDAAILPQNRSISGSYNTASGNTMSQPPLAADLPVSETILPGNQKIAAANSSQATL